MSNYAVIRDGVVENIVVLTDPEDWTPPYGTSIVEIPGGTFVDIGYLYGDSVFSAPNGWGQT